MMIIMIWWWFYLDYDDDNGGDYYVDYDEPLLSVDKQTMINLCNDDIHDKDDEGSEWCQEVG